jgi:hypothetical protein
MKILGILLGTALGACAGASGANALTYVYDLNGTLTGTNAAPLLNSDGGSFATSGGASGYKFDANQGLNVAGALVNPAGDYSIETRFYFNALDGWRKIIDFSDLVSDNGLYNLSTAVQVYPVPQSGTGVFTAGKFADLLLTRVGATGLVNVFVDGVLELSFLDANGYTDDTTSNILRFFEDDHATGQSEASSGFVDFIKISDSIVAPTATPLPAALPLFASGLGVMGWYARRRKRKADELGGMEV